MNFRHLKPADPIAGYVERILVIEDYQVKGQFQLPLFANGVPTLLFQFARGTIDNAFISHLTLFGQTVLPKNLVFNERFTLVAYFFKPWSLVSLFGLGGTELTDRPADLNLLHANKAAQLQEQLLNSATVDEMLSLINKFILVLVMNARNQMPEISYASGKIQANSNREVLRMVQKELHITERTFERKFEKHIGLRPNLYRRVCQFNAAFQQLNSRKFGKLSDIAFQNGFTDQSHFIHSFKEFTGTTPSGFLNYRG